MKKKWKKLVLTEVSPSGWLKEQMQMQMNGLTGCLHEKWDSVGTYSGWLGGTGEAFGAVPARKESFPRSGKSPPDS